MEFDLKGALYVPLENLCLLEATAAVLCEEVLKSSLELTSEEREGLVEIKRDEANHYVLAQKALRGLKTVDQDHLAKRCREYREDHLRRWAGPLAMVARLHEDECLVMRYMHLFHKTIIGIVPEEGQDFVTAVENDEPRHHAWGKAVLRRLTEDNAKRQKFVRKHKSASGWPASDIMRQFRDIQRHMGIE
ncbi:MAG: hypothetical protein V4481_01775 [Patescibacteria group bacterium]